MRRHHRRRLDGLGWSETLSPREGGSWWATRAPVRSGNHVEVLSTGRRRSPRWRRRSGRPGPRCTSPAGTRRPDFALTRGPGALPLRDLLAEVARRVPVRVLLWAGPPLPAVPARRGRWCAGADEFIGTAGSSVPSTGASDDALPPREDRRRRRQHGVRRRDRPHRAQGDRLRRVGAPAAHPMGWHDVAVRLRGAGRRGRRRHFARRWHEVRASSCPPVEPPAPGRPRRPGPAHRPREDLRFAPRGDFTILEAYLRALRSAERFIYLENQFLWSPEVVDVLRRQARPTPVRGLPAPARAARPSPATAPTPPAASSDGCGRRRRRRPAAGHHDHARTTAGGRRRSTCTPRSASWTTAGSPSARRTSTSTRCSTTRR